MLIFHIIVSTLSLLVASLLLVKPAYLKLYASYSLILATISSGTYLVATGSVNILHLCLVGLVYTAVVSYFTVVAQQKLVAQEIDD
ncbi:hypothetical protein KC874_02600 [Candidatus Saccharibacteria bacterium]|jgi:hypothetical protein|nr:hypothetical protein [Candidatus Saccharibacteria bacterium]